MAGDIGSERREPAQLGLGRKLLLALSSSLVALIAAEAAVSVVRQGGFPYLNLFLRDPRYGVVLRPNADAKIRSAAGRVTAIRTNSLGFRGPESPGSGRERILLLGDSQMLGYNVAEEDTAAAELRRRGFDVLVAAVPSWGPIEYARAVEDLAPTYRPSWVVFVANLANDWMEAGVPNTLRSDAIDGWLTRKDALAAAPISFPGRQLLFGRSQLVFLARELGVFWSGGQRPAEGWAIFARSGSGRRSSVDLPPATAALELLRDLDVLKRPKDGHRSRVTPHLVAVNTACRRIGCRVIAAVLPLDVRVHPSEWAKYRTPPKSMVATDGLASDLLDDARDLGIAAVNLLPPLEASSPGAFLPDDVHLSPAGHAAVAGALARAAEAKLEISEVAPSEGSR